MEKYSNQFGTDSDNLPETNIAPENGWLDYDRFLWGKRPTFRGYVMLVSTGFRGWFHGGISYETTSWWFQPISKI